MAYDRYDPRDRSRGGRPRSTSDYDSPRYRDSRDERGFFERASDEIASWWGNDDAEGRRERDERYDDGNRYESPRGRSSYFGSDREAPRDHDQDRGTFGRFRDEPRGDRYYRGSSDDNDRFEKSGSIRQRMISDRPTGAGSGFGGSRSGNDRFGGDRDLDPQYRSLRERHVSELDNDYDEFRRENQSRFEREFGTWREQRMQKRGLLRNIREHMDVVGNDDEHVGTVDRVAGDRIILTKSDDAAGGAHHSLSCGSIDRVEDNKVFLDTTAKDARDNWRDESRSRALFEREDQGEVGPHMLNKSFEGTYR